MDGAQAVMTRSLQFKLSAWISAVILLIAAAGGLFSFVSAFHEANEFQDDQLRQIAALTNRHNVLQLPSADAQQADPIADADARVIVQTLGHRDQSMPAGEVLAVPDDLADGMHTLSVHGEAWRVFVKTLRSGARLAVAQQTAVRDELARDSALRTITPLAVLIPLLLPVVGFLIKRMFIPAKKLAQELDRRSEQDLSALRHTDLPSEIIPFVVAINRLLARVQGSVALQRRFVANAAHELRSPLTALFLQSERLAAAEMSEQARQRLGVLKSGIHRARALLDQLLALARVQETTGVVPYRRSVQRAIRQVLEDMVPLAQAKSIDLGVVEGADAQVAVDEIDLRTLLRNLLDNAVRYTPHGGRVDLRVTSADGQVVLEVDDTGPGIAPAERERVFDPFYRVAGSNELGSGLGLSIVKAIADRIGATVRLSDAGQSPQPGLRVVVTFAKS